MKFQLLLIILRSYSLEYSRDESVASGIPQFLWDMSPPSVFCLNTFLEGFETSLGLTKGWTSNLLNVLDLSFINSLTTLLSSSLTTPKTIDDNDNQRRRDDNDDQRRLDDDNDQRRLDDNDNQRRLDDDEQPRLDELWKEIETINYRNYIQRMNRAIDNLPERHQYDPDGPFLPVWNLVKFEWLIKTIISELPKHSNLIVSTILKNFGLNYQNQTFNSTLPNLLSGLNNQIKQRMILQKHQSVTKSSDPSVTKSSDHSETYTSSSTPCTSDKNDDSMIPDDDSIIPDDDESCDLYARADTTVSESRTESGSRTVSVSETESGSVSGSRSETESILTDEQIWGAFWNSALISRLVDNLVGKIELTLNELFIYAKLSNSGSSICEAVDTSYVFDTINSDTWVCTMLSVIGWLAGCGEESPQCDIRRSVNQSPVPRSICTKSGPIADPLDPETIVDLTMTHQPPERPELVANENDGRVSYWLWRATQYVAGWSAKDYLCNWTDMKPKQLVPGWDTIFEWRSEQSAADLQIATNHSLIPFVFVSKKRDSGCDYLITIRGTVNNFEWVQDWAAAQVNIPGYNSDIHRGAYCAVNVMLPTLENLLENMQRLNCPNDKMRVTIAGHSLGGATAELITLTLASRYSRDQMQLEVVTFGAVNSLSTNGAIELLEAANITSWIGELDGVPMLPCVITKFGSPRCRAIQTFGNWGKGRDVYHQHPHLFVIPISAFEGREPKQMTSDVWGRIKFDLVKMELEELDFEIAGPLQLTAWHICAYGCYLSRTYCVEQEEYAWQCNPEICPII